MIEAVEIRAAEPVKDYDYEWVSAVAHYAVDPGAPASQRIADLDLAPRGSDGRVRFTGDLVLLRPAGGGNGRALVVVPNRGNVRLPYCGVAAARTGRPAGLDTPPATGDGFLLRRGWTLALPGWQWNVPHGAGLAGLEAPVAETGAGWLRCDIRVEARSEELPLGDVAWLGGANPVPRFTAYPADDASAPEATLRVRTAQLGPSRVIARSQWRFTSPTSIALDGGFQPSRWYELIYRSAYAPVAGAGLLALRDVGAYLRTADGGACAAVFASGISQTGRVLREFVFQGLNAGDGGARVFDGIHADIASARRGEFNRRYAQPGLLSPMMPEYGPPYDSAALLARQRELGAVPKLLLTNSAWEYWRGDGALVHQDPVTGADLPEDRDVRTYLISGTDHLGAQGVLKRAMPLANRPHNLDPGPVLRALFVQLERWAVDGIAPPPSAVPRQADGTAVSRESVLESIRQRFPAAALPDASVLPYTPDIDPAAVEWPLPLGQPRVALVSAVDATGNEVAGIRLPAVATGLAAYTGWNPRRPAEDLPDVLYDMAGSRLSTGNTPGQAELLAAARELVARGFLLEEDVELTVRQALADAARDNRPRRPAAGPVTSGTR